MDYAELKTVDAVIDAFGGSKAMSTIFGGGPTRFCNFKANGRFPASFHMQLFAEAHRRGLYIAPELVGVSSADLRRLGVRKLNEGFRAALVEAEARGLNIAPELIGRKRPDPQSEFALQAAE